MRCAWSWCLALAVGCGSSNGSSGSSIRDRPLAQLTPSEQQQACAALQRAYGDYLQSVSTRNSCTFSAALTAREGQTDQAALREQCASLRDECLANYEATPAFCMIPEGCMATLNEWERCYDELTANYAGLYDDVPECEALTLEAAQALMLPTELPEFPASCQTATMKCSVDEQDPPADEDPLIAACTASCQRYETSCGVTMDPSCPSWCNTDQLLSETSGCLELSLSFHECARTAELDCSQDDFWLAIDSACGLADFVFCRTHEGASCAREESFDTYCAEALPETPEGFRCLSSAPYGECLDHPTYGTLFRCCPTGTTF